MIRRADAIAIVLARLRDEIVVTANGWISRETCAADDRTENFYMLGSMGLASSIGLGIAIAQPERGVVILDGDGNLLMTLGTLAMVAERKQRNFLHVVLDNEVYGSTGGQRSLTTSVDLDAIARAAGYVHVMRACEPEKIAKAVDDLLRNGGPSFLLIKVAAEADGEAPRVPHDPEEIVDRVRRSLAG
ncbi:MAG TPA: thiamine pyrophosphate-dependent enzyme [Thermoanaerobaculia bacterium]|nr:thiamine pyrophosphate-dependent enzyme [Thermoanaerobaculia bacterium]